MKNINIRILLTALLLSFIQIESWAQGPYILVKQWGEFGDKPGQFSFPAMVAADKNSDIYVVDQHNHRIQKFDKDGNFILMWGRQGTGVGEFNFPYGIALDSEGNVFVSDMNNNRIQKFTTAGAFIGSTGSYGTGDGQFKYPYGIAVDENDILYVTDAFNYRIQKFSKELKLTGKWGSQESIGFRLYMPHEIAITNDGNIMLSDRQNHRISIFTKDGELVRRFGKFGEGAETATGQFSEPHGVAVNRAGDIFVCDRYNFRIHKISSTGEGQVQWLTPGVSDNSRHFPIGITVAGDETVYITDHYAHCVQKYSVVK